MGPIGMNYYSYDDLNCNGKHGSKLGLEGMLVA